MGRWKERRVDHARRKFLEDNPILILWARGLKDFAILVELRKMDYKIDDRPVTLGQIRARIRGIMRGR